ncbi:MAG: heme transporter CcmC [Thaumarchaeota archaeon]|nr:MAG: putative Heme/copper-type cytochrome/quinol oxidase, subunit [Nitrosopumilales archaeon]MCH8324503.1 heme transporter CcmC [Nitrososphaerota archaeon]
MRSIIGLLFILGILVIIPSLEYAFAQDEPGKYLDRRTVIWNLFFRMMVVAFTIGAVVSGTMVWLVWRFRESNPKATPTEYEKAGEW